MKRLQILLMAALFPVAMLATGTVNQSIIQLGTTGNYALTFYWTGDASSGTIPVTAAQLGVASQLAQGMRILQVEVSPGTPNPTNNYSVQILDQYNGDMMGGSLVSLSPTVTQFFAATTATPPITGTFSLQLSGQAVGGAKGRVVVYFGPTSLINSNAGSPGPTGPTGPTGPPGTGGGSCISSGTYNWTPQAPGGTLTGGGGSQAITLSPVPVGINGTNLGHYVRLTAGAAGAAEDALITGGTAVSGNPSGTIIVSPASNHGSGYTVGPSTAGVEEAAQTFAGSYGNICIPNGTNIFTGPWIAPPNTAVNIHGGGSGTFIQVNQTTGTVFSFGGTGNTVFQGISDLQITAASPVNVQGIAVTASDSVFTARNVTMYNLATGITVVQGGNATFIDHTALLTAYTGAAIGFSCTSCQNISYTNNTYSAPQSSTTTSYGVLIGGNAANNGGIYITGNNIYHPAYGLAVIPTSGQTSQIYSLQNSYASAQIAGIFVQPTSPAFVRSFASTADNVEVGSGDGIVIGGGTGSVDAATLTGDVVDYNVKNGIHLEANAINTTITNCACASNSQGSGNTYNDLLVDAGVSKWNVSGGFYGPGEYGGFSVTGGWSINVAAGASDNYSIVGANINASALGTLTDGGTGLNKVIGPNLGIDNAALATIASAATITLPNDASAFYVTGTTTITTINGGWRGRPLLLIKTDTGTLNIGPGGNVPAALSATQNQKVRLQFDGTNWY